MRSSFRRCAELFHHPQSHVQKPLVRVMYMILVAKEISVAGILEEHMDVVTKIVPIPLRENSSSWVRRDHSVDSDDLSSSREHLIINSRF